MAPLAQVPTATPEQILAVLLGSAALLVIGYYGTSLWLNIKKIRAKEIVPLDQQYVTQLELAKVEAIIVEIKGCFEDYASKTSLKEMDERTEKEFAYMHKAFHGLRNDLAPFMNQMGTVVVMQQKLEKQMDQMQTKSDETHDSVVRIKTILERMDGPQNYRGERS